MTGAGPVGWRDVRDEVLGRIRSRIWAPGDPIPNESDLARDLGCSRGTVNRALQALADAGILERRRRAGTRVARLPVRQARFRIPVLREEIEAAGHRYGYRLLSQGFARPPAAARRGLRDAFPEELVHVVAIHEADGSAYAHEDRWINPDAVPGVRGADFSGLSANEWLLRHAPISDGEIVFLAREAGEGEAAVFGCAPGAALFRAERRTWHQGRPVTTVSLTFRPGHRLETTI